MAVVVERHQESEAPPQRRFEGSPAPDYEAMAQALERGRWRPGRWRDSSGRVWVRRPRYRAEEQRRRRREIASLKRRRCVVARKIRGLRYEARARRDLRLATQEAVEQSRPTERPRERREQRSRARSSAASGDSGDSDPEPPHISPALRRTLEAVAPGDVPSLWLLSLDEGMEAVVDPSGGPDAPERAAPGGPPLAQLDAEHPELTGWLWNDLEDRMRARAEALR